MSERAPKKAARRASDVRRASRDSRSSNSITWVRAMAGGGLVRLTVLPLSAVCSVLTARITIESTSLELYGYVNTIAMIFQLFPYADLGVGVAVTNAVARRHAESDSEEQIYRAVLGAARIVVVVALAVIGSAALVIYSGMFSGWLGLPLHLAESGQTAIFIALAAWSCSIPLGMLGYRILVGAGQNTQLALVSVIAPMVTLLYSFVVHLVGGHALFFAIGPALGILLTDVISVLFARRTISIPLARLFMEIPKILRYPGAKVVHTAWPMLLIMASFALILYSHRLLLANFSDARTLATYALAVQLFLPAWSVVNTAGLALWSEFQASGELYRTWLVANLLLLGVSVAGAAGLYLLGPYVVRIMSPESILVPSTFLLAFGLLLIIMGIDLAQTMLLVSAAALRRRAAFAVASALTFAIVCVPAIRFLGGEGVIWVTCGTFFMLQTVPNFIFGFRAARAGTCFKLPLD